MKRSLKIVIPIIILIIFLVGLFIVYKNTYKIELKKEEFIYELGEKISSDVSNYLKDADANKNIKDYKLSSESLKKDNDLFIMDELELVPVGEYIITIDYKKKSVDFVIKVKDTIAPEFSSFKDTIEIEETEDKLDLTTYFKAEDLTKVKLLIEGEYDLKKVGEYKLKVVAEDENDNITSKDFILKIKKKIEERPKAPEKKQTTNNSKSTTPPSNKPSNNISNNNTSGSPKYRRDISNSFANQINIYREENGLSELPITSEAQSEADRRSKEISINYSHDGAGYGFGENIGYGGIGSDFIAAWKNSPSHNATMLREQNVAMAVSVYEANGMWYAVTSFRMNY